MDITPRELEQMFSSLAFGSLVERVERITGLDFQSLPEYKIAETAMSNFYRVAREHYLSNLNEIASDWYSHMRQSEEKTKGGD